MVDREDKPRRQPPIAIVGIGGLFPGSLDVAQFWNHLLRGTDLITDIPNTHWSVDDYYDPDPSTPDKTYGKRGGFLPEVPFDSLKWGVPPNLLPSTDTSQLLGLLVARTTLQDCFDGGLDEADKSRISVLLGVTSGQELFGQMAGRLQHPQWRAGMRAAGIEEDLIDDAVKRIGETMVPWTESTFPGLLGNVVAGRIANRLDTGGTNAVTDAACASSFAALSMGIDELVLERADVVLTGGVDTLNDIFMHMCFSKTPALSASGQVRPFDENADGTLLGEGLGMVALKRLEDAERDGNHIYAVIRGVGTSSDGRSKSVYAPVPEGQASAIRRAYAAAGYGPGTVELVEAHGTGTRAGDVAELGGLKLAFEESGREDRQWCAVGTVKSQIGHTKAAAGSAGLLKAALALHHRVLPPTINVDTPNPKAALEDSPLYLNSEARPWVRDSDHPRRASVSSFGFGGSNFHVTLEEYLGSARALRLHARHAELFCVSATSTDSLGAQLTTLVNAPDSASLAELAHECTRTFNAAHEHRAAFTAEDLAQLRRRASDAVAVFSKGNGARVPGVHTGQGPAEGKVAFVFPGQGSQYVGMGNELAREMPQALSAWDDAADVSLGDVPLHRVVFPPPAFHEAGKAAQAATLTATQNAQPALGVASVAALRALRALDLHPDMVGGHSFGELVALHAAGVFTYADLLRLARRRGELMATAARTPGAMLAVSATRDAVEAALGATPGVVVANHNAPEQVVLSGTTDAIDDAAVRMDAAGLRCTRLRVATAFHSPVVAPAAEGLAEFLRDVDVMDATLPVFANTTAAPYPTSADGVRDTLAAQVREPVRWVDEVEAMYAAGARIFVEVGPGKVLSGLVRRTLGERAHLAIATDARDSGVTALLDACAQLLAAGVPLALDALFEDRALVPPGAEPDAANKPSLRTPVGGSNLGKPPLPAPRAPRARPATRPLMVDDSKPPAAAVQPAAAPASTQVRGSAGAPVSPVPHAAAAPTQTPTATLPMAAAPSADWLDVFREGQQQAAEAHAAFQRSMANAHASFLAAFETSSSQLAQVIAGAPVTAASTSAAVQPAVVAPALVTPAVVAPAVVAPAVVALATPAPIAPSPPPTSPMRAAPIVPAAPAPAPSPAPVIAASAVELSAATAAPTSASATETMLRVTSEKTGYPIEALDLGMSLEADLGIDSIKRVEILGGVREALPTLPEIDAVQLGQLATLGEIVAYLDGLDGGRGPASTSTGGPAAPFADDLQQIFLEVVADKTGYPTEALNLDMSLEADLGIDSIKRVEILGGIKERVPSLPDVDAVQLGQLVTLGEIVAALGASAPTPGASASSPSPQTAASQAPTGAAAGDVAQVFLEVVADKTGYPTEALNLEMSLEADLGIDSIKRVEILGGVKERLPHLPDVDAVQLGQLVTLGEIVAALGASSPDATTAAALDVDVDVAQVFLQVVADKTGYPTDALNLDMSLEGDLGIDSIKRVEILGGVKERLPQLPDVDAVQLGQLVTLGEIVNALDADFLDGDDRSPAETGALSAVADAHTAVERAVLRVVPLDGAARAPELARGVQIGVVPDERGFADALVTELSARGHTAQVLRGNGHTPRGPFDVLVHLGGIALHDDDNSSLDSLTRAFELTQRYAGGLRASADGRFFTVQDTGGDFGLSRALPRARALLGGIAALSKTVAQEWPSVRAKAIDVDLKALPLQDAVQLVAEEIVGGADALEVGLTLEGRIGLAVSPAKLSGATEPLLSSSDVVVATGGARGVTAIALQELARSAKPRLVLLGRTDVDAELARPEARFEDEAGLKRALFESAKRNGEAVSPAEIGARAARIASAHEVSATVERLRAAGAEVMYLPVDIRDANSLESALDKARARFGPITALVHGAGVLADKRIEDKSTEDFQRVVDTKLRGLLALLDATQDDPIRAMALFSSVAGRHGNTGQVDYAIANESLNKVAQSEARRRGDACVVKSLNWGPWDGGMVTDALRAMFASRGVALVTAAAGARFFVEELSTAARDAGVEVVFGGPLDGDSATASTTGASASSVEQIAQNIDAAGFGFLKDHALRGMPVLPAVMAIHLMAQAARQRETTLTLRAVRGLRVLRGIPLSGFSNGGNQLRVALFEDATAAGATRTLRAEVRADGSELPRYVAHLDLGLPLSDTPTPQPAPAGLTPFPADRAEIYRDMLFHGPSFQLVDEVEGVGPSGIVGRVRRTRDAGWDGPHWMVDVGALDAGLQLVLLFARHELGGAFLPTSIGGFTTYSDVLDGGSARCQVRARAEGNDRVVAQVSFVDDEGRLLMEMRDVEAHRLPDDNAFSHGANERAPANA